VLVTDASGKPSILGGQMLDFVTPTYRSRQIAPVPPVSSAHRQGKPGRASCVALECSLHWGHWAHTPVAPCEDSFLSETTEACICVFMGTLWSCLKQPFCFRVQSL
jgi:hypothetical protein